MIKPISPQFIIIFLLINIFAFLSSAQTKAKSESQVQSATSYTARMNETLVYNALRQIHAAQVTYQATAGNGNFVLTLGDLAALDFIDELLGSGEKYRYVFSMSVKIGSTNNPAFFVVTATPSRYPKRGRRSFYLDSSGAVRGADKNGAAATINDPFVVICGAHERETIQTLRAIVSAEFTYQATFGTFGTLQNLHSTGLVDFLTARGDKCGYNLTLLNKQTSFNISSVPQHYPVSGRRSFYVDEDGVIRGADRNGQPATAGDPPIEF